MNGTISKKYPDVANFLRTLNGGGAERVYLNLDQFFLQQNLKVDMVLARAKGPLLKQLPSDIRLIDLQGQSKLSMTLKLAKYLRVEKPTSLLAALHYPCEKLF